MTYILLLLLLNDSLPQQKYYFFSLQGTCLKIEISHLYKSAGKINTKKYRIEIVGLTKQKAGSVSTVRPGAGKDSEPVRAKDQQADKRSLSILTQISVCMIYRHVLKKE